MIPLHFRSSIYALYLDGQPAGTAFVLDEAHVATAAHVLVELSDGSPKGTSIALRGDSRIVLARWEDCVVDLANDVAVVGVEHGTFSPAFPLADAASVLELADRPARWDAWGFPPQIN